MYRGKSALDDIEFEDCALPVQTSPVCGPSQFSCNNGVCIDQDYLCDMADNCGDASDEDGAYCSKSNIKSFFHCFVSKDFANLR